MFCVIIRKPWSVANDSNCNLIKIRSFDPLPQIMKPQTKVKSGDLSIMVEIGSIELEYLF